MTTIIIMSILVVSSAIALWHTLDGAINRMSARTHHGVRIGYVLKASGQFGMILACIDYLHGDPMAWPWLLLLAATINNAGTGIIHVSTRRACKCSECPIRGGDTCVELRRV